MEKVSIVKCENYEEVNVITAVIRALEEIEFVVPVYKKVLIKPNIFAQNKPEQHSITNYTIIDILCRLLKDNNCKIQIGESTAFYQRGQTRKAFITSRMNEIAKKYNAELIAFEEEKLVKVTENLSIINELYLPEKLLEADLIINACKLKSHSGLRLSGALKNIFGVIPGGYKQKFHLWTKNDFELSDIFINIWMQISNSVSIMDAVYGLDGGPSANGKPKFIGTIIASKNPAALDTVAANIIGYEASDISTLTTAKNRGLINSFNEIKIIGDVPKTVFKNIIKGSIPLHKKKEGIFITQTSVKPFIKKIKCNNCGECLEDCPTSAIFYDSDEKPIINLKKCINCYYCISICKEKAVKIKSSLINKFIRFMRLLLRI